MKSIYKGWKERYAPEFIEESGENFAIVKSMDPKKVWTAHSTCDSEQLTPGAHWFNNSCCWDTFGWHISKVSWRAENNYIDTLWSGPCPECNSEDDNDGVSTDCESCRGDGFTEVSLD
jgi:hypothetical protein